MYKNNYLQIDKQIHERIQHHERNDRLTFKVRTRQSWAAYALWGFHIK